MMMNTGAAVLLLTLPYALSTPSGPGLLVNDTELTCNEGPSVLLKYINPILKDLESALQSYKTCNEATQKYTLEIQGYQAYKQAGKEGSIAVHLHEDDSLEYGFGMLCVGGDMYYIFTADPDKALWDAFKACPPDESKVILKCLVKRRTITPIFDNTACEGGKVRDNDTSSSSLSESPSEDDSTSEIDEAEDDEEEEDWKMKLFHNSRLTFVMIGVVPMLCMVGLIAARLRRHCQSNPLQRLHDEPEAPQTGKATVLGSPSKSVNIDQVVVDVGSHA